MRKDEHFVQFYESDGFLLDSLNSFIGAGLTAGEGCIVIATQERRVGLKRLLQASGVDVDAVTASGQFISLDAAQTLANFLVDGELDTARFNEIVGGIIARASEGRRGVRIFGEMVALLWAEGNHDFAIRLEELWNKLQETHSYSLFCAYPLNGFGVAAHAEPLKLVCETHSRVIPAESYLALTDADERLRAITLLQQKARSLQLEIAERKEAEERLRVSLEEHERLLIREQIARAEAESANRLKDEFLATVSHELRTPLNAIMGWSYMLRHSGVDEATKLRGLETIERNAQSQAQLIEDILDVSRVITGKLRLNIGPVDLASVINAAIDSVQLAADTKGIKLGVTLDPSARHVSGDANRLQQVMWNLLSNAIKFTPAGGRVEIRMEHVGDEVQIGVSDTGCGVSAEFLPYIFDRFRQADGTSTRNHGGLGLGLAIVRHLVELHGGSAHAASPGEGGGATFTIRLPLVIVPERTTGRRKESKAFAVGSASGVSDGPSRSLKGVRVILVDDDLDTLQMLTLLLAEHKAEVQGATSAAQALELLRWFEPDVLVSDLAMQGEDGYSLIGKIRAKETETGKRIPAIALTAFVRVEDRARALSAGFNMFVPKPVEPEELIATIAHLTEPTIS